MAGIHEEILYENAWRDDLAENVEIGRQVGIAIGIVSAETLAGKMELCSIVQVGSKIIGLGVTSGGICAPAGCIDPIFHSNVIVMSRIAKPLSAMLRGV